MKHTLLTATFSILTVLAFAQYSGTIYVYPPGSNQGPTLKGIIDGLHKDGMNGNVTLRLNAGNYGEVSIGEIARIGSPNRKLTIRPISNSTTVTFDHLALDETHYTDLRYLKFVSGNRPEALYAYECQRLRIFDCDFETQQTAVEVRYPETYTVIRRCNFHNTNSIASGWATLITTWSSGNSNLLDTYYQDNTVTGGFHFGTNISNSSNGKNYVLDNDIRLDASGAARAMGISSNGGKVWLNRNVLISEGPNYYGTGNGGSSNVQPVASIFFFIGSYGDLIMKNNMISGPRKSLSITRAEAYVRHNSLNSHSGTGVNFSASDITFENNIVKSLAAVLQYDAGVTFTQIDNNLYRSINSHNEPFGIYPNTLSYQGINYGDWKALGRDANSIFGDPQFLSPYDLHINSNSPAIDYGYIVGNITTDIDGDSRSTKADLGADEANGKKSALAINASNSEQMELTAYPNPNNGQFRLEADVAGNANYSVLDFQGRLIVHGALQKGFIDLKGIAPGTYVVQLIDGNRVGTTAVVVR